ncbi:MAG: hypothetical protein ACP5OO_10790 [Chloroflexia bacterium]
MTDFRERVFRSRDESKLKKLASYIPGYGGYLDKEMRRDADKLLRDYVAARLEQQRKRLTETQQELLAGGGLALMDDVDRVQKKLQLLGDRLRTAVYGYAGWFDAVVIREDALNALYDYDATLIGGADQLAEEVQAFAQAVAGRGDVQAALKRLQETLNGLHEQVDRRRDILIGAVPPVPPAEPSPPSAPIPPTEPSQPAP